MSHGNGVVAGESLPAMAPDETAIAVPCHLYPAQDVVQDRKQSLAEGASALHDSSANGKTGEAWTKAQMAKADAVAVEAEAKAKSAVAKADAEARVAEAEALEAEAKAQVAEAEAEAKAQVAVAEAEAKARAAEAEAAIKIRVAEAEMRKADLKIVKLRKELEVLTGESEVQEYLLFLSLRPSLCLSLTACFSDLNSLGSPYSVFASVFLSFLSDRRAAGQRR